MAQMASNHMYSRSRVYGDRDTEIIGLDSRIKRLNEIINNHAVKEKKLIEKNESLTKTVDALIEENQELKTKVEKIYSRFDILDL